MRTRDVVRWNLSPAALVEIAGLALATLALTLLDRAADRIELWIDQGAHD